MFKAAIRITILTTGLMLSACDSQPEIDLSEIYFINEYNPERDPFSDLEQAVEKARLSGRHILMEVGGEWCVWCHILDDFVETHPKIAEAIKQHYVFIKINFSDDNKNTGFLGQYPEIPGYPHLFVLNHKGELIHSQGTLALEKGESYSEPQFLDFLERWKP